MSVLTPKILPVCLCVTFFHKEQTTDETETLIMGNHKTEIMNRDCKILLFFINYNHLEIRNYNIEIFLTLSLHMEISVFCISEHGLSEAKYFNYKGYSIVANMFQNFCTDYFKVQLITMEFSDQRGQLVVVDKPILCQQLHRFLAEKGFNIFNIVNNLEFEFIKFSDIAAPPSLKMLYLHLTFLFQKR